MMPEWMIILTATATLAILFVYRESKYRKNREKLRQLRETIQARDLVWVEVGPKVYLMSVTGILHEKGTKNGEKFTEKKIIVRDEKGNVTAISMDKVFPRDYLRK
jgi:hypothetical protein